MLLHHVEGNSPARCRIDPRKLKWGLENFTWAIFARKGREALPSRAGVRVVNVLPYFTGL